MPKSRLSAVLSVLLVFSSGAVLGAFVYRLYATTSVVSSNPTTNAPQHRMTPEEWRKNYTASLSKTVKLDEQQMANLNKILDEIRDEVVKLREKSKPEQDALDEKWRPEREAIQTRQVAAINAMLRPDQRPFYESWRTERDRLHKQQRDQHKKQ
jgi:gas vesicle protein